MGIQLNCLGVMCASLIASTVPVQYVQAEQTVPAEMNHTFTAELQEVRTGSINGREYLTIHIDSSVGPANCQGSKLRVDTHSVNTPGKQAEMESIALEAMLTSERVVITVPLNSNECVDGMPTLTDINLITRVPLSESLSLL